MNPPASILNLDTQLCFALYSSSLAMTKACKQLLAALGITYPQYLVLLALWQHGVQGVGEIGARLCLDSGTLTPLTKRLEVMGLIARVRNSADERHVDISLTVAGQRLRVKAEAIPPCIMQLSGCQPSQHESLTDELKVLRDHLIANAKNAATLAQQPVSPMVTTTATASAIA